VCVMYVSVIVCSKGCFSGSEWWLIKGGIMLELICKKDGYQKQHCYHRVLVMCMV
jgi:hypothetical protein